MTTKYLKTGLTVVLTLVLTISTYQFCYFIAEKYFFDKFFFFKSISHGYSVPGTKNNSLKKYGDRARDLIVLSSDKKNVLGVTTDKKIYNIAIIGDSFVWGQGIRNDQRFATLIEKQLNKIRPTKVYSFGSNGDNAFDDYQKYQESINVFGPMNTYIFGFYNNDLVFNHDDRYQTSKLLSEKLSIGCTGESIYDPDFDPNNLNDLAFYQAKLKSLKENTVNLCSFRKLANLLPKENALYIDLGSIENDHEVKRDFAKITSQYFSVLTLNSSDYLKARVSIKEGHPSAYSNQLYTDAIVKEITTNPKYKFNEQF
ncbi:MAG: hypothetical protein WC851_02545 [Candidatus Shapirobacteria bacterium]|jgi:hypothetical protein